MGVLKMVAGPVLEIIDKLVPDKDKANELKSELSLTLLGLDSEILDAQKSVIMAESQGSWLQRNWRPGLMVLFAGLITAHWFGFTPQNMSDSVVNSLLDIVMVGVGGYVVGRSGEKIARTLKDE